MLRIPFLWRGLWSFNPKIETEVQALLFQPVVQRFAKTSVYS
jgi:hypothetical protein